MAPGLGAQPAAERTAELDAPKCEGLPYDHAALLELLRVELGAQGVQRVIPSGSTPVGEVKLSITPAGCDPKTTELVLTVSRKGVPAVKERRMPLADVAEANRSRALAIALAELFREPDAAPTPPAVTPEKPSAPAVSPVIPPPAMSPADPIPKPPPRRVAPWLGAGAIARTFPSESVAVLGIEAFTALPLSRELRLSLGVDAQSGQAAPGTDSYTVGAVTAWVGASLMYGDAAQQLELGPRLHVGYGWAKDAVLFSPDRHSDHLVLLGTLVGTVHVGLEKELHGHVGIELGAGLLDNELLDDSMVDERGSANDIGLVIEIGVRLGVDYEL